MKYKNNPNTKCKCSNPKHHALWILDKQNIIKSIEEVIKTKNIDNLTKDTYDFVNALSGFIAHYNINGFKTHYENTADFVKDLQNSADLSNYNRYITDSFFSKNEQKQYYADKREILKNIKELVKNIKITNKVVIKKYSENVASY